MACKCERSNISIEKSAETVTVDGLVLPIFLLRCLACGCVVGNTHYALAPRKELEHVWLDEGYTVELRG